MAEKRIPFELRVERVWERRPEFLEMNPACTVPVLQEPTGLAIADSYATYRERAQTYMMQSYGAIFNVRAAAIRR